jgi:hypothetical protein
MRDKRDGLNKFPEGFFAAFRNQNCQDYGRNDTGYQFVKAYKKRIAHKYAKIRRFEKYIKMLGQRISPGTVQYASSKIIILKTQRKAIHRVITEYGIIGKGWYQHKKQLFVTPKQSESSSNSVAVCRASVSTGILIHVNDYNAASKGKISQNIAILSYILRI